MGGHRGCAGARGAARGPQALREDGVVLNLHLPVPLASPTCAPAQALLQGGLWPPAPRARGMGLRGAWTGLVGSGKTPKNPQTNSAEGTRGPGWPRNNRNTENRGERKWDAGTGQAQALARHRSRGEGQGSGTGSGSGEGSWGLSGDPCAHPGVRQGPSLLLRCSL